MRFCEFLLLASSCNILICHSSSEQEKDEVILENPEISKADKVTINFGDLAIEVRPPRGRENILSNTETIYENWKDPDDVAYWDAIYGHMGDIPPFEDLPKINGDTVELEYIGKFNEERLNEKHENLNENVSVEKYPDDYEKNDYDSSAKKLSREAKSIDLSKDRCQWTNPFYSVGKSSNRQKRETNDAEKKVESSKPEIKSKDENLSLHQDESVRSRRKVGFHSGLRSGNSYDKYGRNHDRDYRHERDSWEDYDQDNGEKKYEKFIDSRIAKDSLVNLKSAVVNTGKAVVNAVKQLAQANDKVINLELENARPTGTKNLNKPAGVSTDCSQKRPDGRVNVDSDVEIVGNSIVDTKSGIINADSSISSRITTFGTDKVSDRFDKSNVKIVTDEVVENEIVPMENVPEIDEKQGKVVVQDVKTIEKKSDVESNSEKVGGITKLMSKTSSGKEKLVGSKMQVKTDTVEKNTVEKKVEKNHNHGNSGGGLKRHDSSCYCAASGEERCDSEEEAEEEEEGRYCRRRFPPKGKYRLNHRDHERRDSEIHAKTSHSKKIAAGAGIDTSLDSEIEVNADFDPGKMDSGGKTSLELQSSVDIGSRIDDRKDENYDYDNAPVSYNDKFSSTKGTCDYDAEEYREYRRIFPYYDRYEENSRVHQGKHSAIRAKIQKSLDAGTEIDSNDDSLGIGAKSGIHAGASLKAEVGTKSSLVAGDFHAGGKTLVDSLLEFERSGSSYPGENHRATNGFNGGCGRHEEYDNRSKFREFYKYQTDHPDYRETEHSGIRANAGIHTSPDVDANIEVSDIRKSLDATINLNSDKTDGYRRYETDEDDGRSEYEADYEDEREYRRRYEGSRDGEQNGFSYQAINSEIYDQSVIDSSLNPEVDINSGMDASLGIGDKSSLEFNSRLDIEGKKLDDNVAGPLYHLDSINSGIRADHEIHSFIDSGVNSNGKSSRDIDSNLDTKGSLVTDEKSRIEMNVNNGGENIPTDDEVPYMCEECRRRLYRGLNSPCRFCKRPSDQFQQQRSFLPMRTIYHLNAPPLNFGLTEVSSGPVETFTKSKRSCKRYINLDVYCTDEASHENSECQDKGCVFRTIRDGNSVPLDFIRTHLKRGYNLARDMHDRARSLAAGGLHPSPHTASMLSFFHNKACDSLVSLNEESELTLFGTKILLNKLCTDYNVTPNTFFEFLDHHGFRVKGMRICHQNREKRCIGWNKFRSLDGSCNNLAYSTWGQSNTAFGRILPPRYSDGIHGMPRSVTNDELPNARRLSVQLYTRGSNFDSELTLAVVQWGQTVAHDLARQVMDQTTQGGIECCADNGKSKLAKFLQHHSCAPISISPNDKFYSSRGQRCMNFVRAMTAPKEDCTLGPADQLNGATSFLDCSPMYGTDKSASDELRAFTGGRMKVEFRSGRWMLPTTKNQSNFCDILTSEDICYRSGDPRTNQNPQLVILQTLLVREHNRVANGLSALNPSWNDERIFQETRRIVIAEYQHITYNEWLPLLLGNGYAKKYGLVRNNGEMSNAYREDVNPSTLSGFTSAAFRSLHSMIEGNIGLCNIERRYVDTIRLSDHYFRPKVIEKDNQFELLLRGLITQPMQMQDMNLHSELTEYLFRSHNDYGMDLAAIDIQRGRDHGVPGYNAYREICRLEPAEDFDDLHEEISRDNIEKLKRAYAHVDDIDLIVGASMENRSPGSQFGPTNLCIISEQFYRSRVGDRYFYDNANLPHSFTPKQFYEITKVSLSRLMCDMGGAVGTIQRNAFRALSSENRIVACEDLPKMDLTLWKE